MARPDPLRAALADGRIPLGMQSFSGSAQLVEVIGRTGFDFVMLDTEHTFLGWPEIEALVRVADGAGLTTIVRVPENETTSIRRALEAGASGIVVPRISSAAELEQALRAARFPPLGERGSCVAVRGTGYSTQGWEEYRRFSNDDVFVIPLVETLDAIENAEEICSLPGVEIVFFGPGDLGLALGLGIDGLAHPTVQTMLDRLIEVAHRAGTRVMCVPFPDLSPAACRDLVDRGIDLLLHSVDVLLFSHLCAEITSELAPVIQSSDAQSEQAPRDAQR